MRHLVALALVLAAPLAHASVVEPLSVPEMARRAPVIVHAVVGAAEVREERGRLVTYTPLRVVEAFKGARRGSTLLLFQPGGQRGGRTSGVVGQPRYRAGEEIVVFLAPHRRGELDVVVHLSLGQGVFDVGPTGTVRERTDAEVGMLDAGGRARPLASRAFPSIAAFRAALFAGSK